MERHLHISSRAAVTFLDTEPRGKQKKKEPATKSSWTSWIQKKTSKDLEMFINYKEVENLGFFDTKTNKDLSHICQQICQNAKKT